MRAKKPKFNPSKIKGPTVLVVRWTSGWTVMLWIPRYHYALSHDSLGHMDDAKAARRHGRRLAKLLGAAFVCEDLSGE